MNGDGPRAGGLRLIRTLIVGLCIGVTVLSFATVLLWRSNDARVQQINNERAANVRRNCEDVNDRHRDTIQAVDELLAPRLKTATPAERKQMRASRDSTVLILNALVPMRDCDRLVRTQVATK